MGLGGWDQRGRWNYCDRRDVEEQPSIPPRSEQGWLGVVKLHECGAAFAAGLGVPSLKGTGFDWMKPIVRLLGERPRIPDGGPYPCIRAVSHGMKPLARRAQEISTTTSFREPLSKHSPSMSQSSLQSSTTAWRSGNRCEFSTHGIGLEASSGPPSAGEEVVILFWIVWFSATWQEELVPGTCWATARRATSLAALAGGGNVWGVEQWPGHRCWRWLGRYVNNQHCWKRWQRGVVGQVVVLWWWFNRGNWRNQWSEHENSAREVYETFQSYSSGVLNSSRGVMMPQLTAIDMFRPSTARTSRSEDGISKNASVSTVCVFF